MPDKLVAAIIAASVSLITALVSGTIAWKQIRIGREKWREEIEQEQEKWKRQIEQEQERWKREIRQETIRWLTDLKSKFNLELYKARLESYPNILEVFIDFSTNRSEAMTPEEARLVAHKINGWLYSTGGLCASKEVRGALLGIRKVCSSWSLTLPTEEWNEQWRQLWTFRNFAVLSLRRDLDIKGLESYDFDNLPSVLDELKSELSYLGEALPPKTHSNSY